MRRLPPRRDVGAVRDAPCSTSTTCASSCRPSAKFPSLGRWQIILDRGRRPARHPGEPAHRQRAAQGDRGADAQDALAAVRADPRRRAADDRVPLAARHPGHPDRRASHRVPGPRRGIEPTVASLRRPRQPGPHRPRARAVRSTRTPRSRRREVVSLPARLTSLGSCMTAATNLDELAKEETAGDHRRGRAARAREPAVDRSAASARTSPRAPTAPHCRRWRSCRSRRPSAACST